MSCFDLRPHILTLHSTSFLCQRHSHVWLECYIIFATYADAASANEQHLPTGPAIDSKGMKKKLAKMKLVVIVMNMNPPNSAHALGSQGQ